MTRGALVRRALPRRFGSPSAAQYDASGGQAVGQADRHARSAIMLVSASPATICRDNYWRVFCRLIVARLFVMAGRLLIILFRGDVAAIGVAAVGVVVAIAQGRGDARRAIAFFAVPRFSHSARKKKTSKKLQKY